MQGVINCVEYEAGKRVAEVDLLEACPCTEDGSFASGKTAASGTVAVHQQTIVVAASQDSVEVRERGRTGGAEGVFNDEVWGPGGGDIVAHRQLKADELLKDGGHATAPRVERQPAPADAVDLDGARLGVVQSTQELRQRRLAGSVAADNRH